MSYWRELFSSALLETNPECLELLLAKTETAISEQVEMEKAAKIILAIRTEELGWPNPHRSTFYLFESDFIH